MTLKHSKKKKIEIKRTGPSSWDHYQVISFMEADATNNLIILLKFIR